MDNFNRCIYNMHIYILATGEVGKRCQYYPNQPKKEVQCQMLIGGEWRKSNGVSLRIKIKIGPTGVSLSSMLPKTVGVGVQLFDNLLFQLCLLFHHHLNRLYYVRILGSSPLLKILLGPLSLSTSRNFHFRPFLLRLFLLPL